MDQKKGKKLKSHPPHQVTVISGDTGCGKTTQLPQLVLDQVTSLSSNVNSSNVNFSNVNSSNFNSSDVNLRAR
jgi:Cdc6-like AAA superfamily ATPase